MEPATLDTIGTLVGMVLTLLVFSYLLGDNILYRLAEHLFVGVAVGYAVVIAFHNVLAPKLFSPLVSGVQEGNWGQASLLLIALVFGLLLLLKPFRSLSWLGNMSVALMLGVGAALAIGGALLGTLWPQIDATASLSTTADLYEPGWGLFSAIVVLVGTIGALFHFYRGGGDQGRLAGLRNFFVGVWGGLGRWFVLVAFAAILATTFLTRLSLLVGRIQFLLDGVRDLLGV
ncbi:MAG: hypothetical protein P8129_06515 [Anaerolineae bacterium]|jgi:hypothetical protein